jgi:hypothetical protein
MRYSDSAAVNPAVPMVMASRALNPAGSGIAHALSRRRYSA